MSRSLAVAAVSACVLAFGGAVALAAPTTPPGPVPTPVPVPGAKEPVESIGLSGGLFNVTSGAPGCYGSGGTSMAGFPVPRGAVVTGVTAYVVDSFPDRGIAVSLNRHDLTTGGTYRLGNASTSGAPGSATVAIALRPGVRIDKASSVNVDVTVGKGTCFKGAEVHFIRGGTAPAPEPTATARAAEPTVTGARPDGVTTR